VRASLGVSAFPDHGDDQADLLLAADRALYQAKEQGRNRVVTAAPGATAVRDVPSMLDE
jgi:diguanylate cyclase (GGDEF)-like protein